MGAPPLIQQYREAGQDPPLPEIPPGGEYLIDAMFALRPTRPMPMGGVRPADWPEIWPFMQATGVIADRWEAEALRSMCEAFCAGLKAGEKPGARSPMERG